MIIITQVNSILELEQLSNKGVNEIIVAPKKISRRGTLSLQETNIILEKACFWDFKVFVQADILILEDDFLLIFKFLKKIRLDLISAIRVQDLGLASYINKELNVSIHLICETGYHNLASVIAVKKQLHHLTRIVLSLEVPVHILEQWIKTIDLEVEILILGPLLIFYSSRKLLSNIKKHHVKSQEIISSKEILSDMEFQVVENIHGTFLYYSKDICFFKYINELKKIGINVFRVDRFDNPDLDIFDKLSQKENDLTLIDEKKLSLIWGKDLFHSFYKSNKTDLRFKVLKNNLRCKKGDDFLAVVLEASREIGDIVLYTKKELKKGMNVFIKTPLGDKKIFILTNLKNSYGNECDVIKKDKIAVIPFRKGVSSQSLCFLNGNIE